MGRAGIRHMIGVLNLLVIVIAVILIYTGSQTEQIGGMILLFVLTITAWNWSRIMRRLRRED